MVICLMMVQCLRGGEELFCSLLDSLVCYVGRRCLALTATFFVLALLRICNLFTAFFTFL